MSRLLLNVAVVKMVIAARAGRCEVHHSILRPGVVSATMIGEREDPFVVEGVLLTDVGGTIAAKVLSTPGMIAKMERCAAMLALDHLPADRATVGFEVCVRHVAGAGEGARCTARAVLREIVDGRKLRFDIEVRDGERLIGVGTHERRTVNRA
jgi:fluoroacetyl-CoA thioesterase